MMMNLIPALSDSYYIHLLVDVFTAQPEKFTRLLVIGAWNCYYC